MKKAVRSKWSEILLVLITIFSIIFMFILHTKSAIGLFGFITVMSQILVYARKSLIEYWDLLEHVKKEKK